MTKPFRVAYNIRKRYLETAKGDAGMKIHVLYLGRIECKKDNLVKCADKSEMIKSPISAILIEHPKLGNILYDTGNSPFYTAEYPEETLETYPIPEFISIQEALAQKGFLVSDMDLIVLSHLHFDHAGGLRYFAGTKAAEHVLVAEPELKNAFYQVMTGQPGAYVKALFDFSGICYQTINETTKLADDVELFIQKSHTPGVIGMRLTTQGGTLLVTGDTIYTRESYEKEIPPGGNINKTESEFFDNLNRIRQMQKEYQAEVLFGHDYEQIISWSTTDLSGS